MIMECGFYRKRQETSEDIRVYLLHCKCKASAKFEMIAIGLKKSMDYKVTE